MAYSGYETWPQRSQIIKTFFRIYLSVLSFSQTDRFQAAKEKAAKAKKTKTEKHVVNTLLPFPDCSLSVLFTTLPKFFTLNILSCLISTKQFTSFPFLGQTISNTFIYTYVAIYI